MARQSEFSHEQIIAAGLRLQAAGATINSFSLRKEVGGGNPARLLEVWNSHKTSTEQDRAEQDLKNLPDEIVNRIREWNMQQEESCLRFVASLHSNMQDSAQQQIDDMAQNHATQAREQAVALDEAAATIDELETVRDDLAAQLASQSEALQQAHIQLATLNQQLQHATQALQEAKGYAASAIQELQATQAIRHQLDAERAQLVTQLAATKEALAHASAKQNQADIEAARLTERLSRAEADRDKALAGAQEHAVANMKAQTDLARQAGQIEALTQQIQAAQPKPSAK